MKSLKYTVLVALLTWWVPFLGGIITGLVSGFAEKKISQSVISALIASISASILYVSIFTKIVYVPILGNLLPILAIIFSAISTVISVIVAYFISANIVRFSAEGNKAKIEFYAKNQEEIEEKLKPYEYGCETPHYSFYEDKKVIVTRRCNGFTLRYEITKEDRRYKVKLYIES